MPHFNSRLLIALGTFAVLALGVLTAFLPFQQGNQRMQDFCTGLSAGSSRAQLAVEARSHGYLLSSEVPPSVTLDAGDLDAGEGLAGAIPTPTRIVPGDALITDPRLPRPTCALFFGDAGTLLRAVFDAD